MNAKWNCSCGQCAGCSHCGNCGSVAGNADVPCCDTCGLNTSALEISATSQETICSCGHCHHGGASGQTGSDTSAPCCDTCALTINPDGTALVQSQSSERPRRNLRAACSNGGGRRYRPCAAPERQGNCAAQHAPACQAHGNPCGGHHDAGEAHCGCGAQR